MQTALTGSQSSISVRSTAGRLSWLVLTGALVMAPTALAADSFGTLLGAWSGDGFMHLEDGRQEAIACTAGYKEKDAGKKMTMTLTCDSDRYKVDLRSRLSHKDGALSGGWFEKIREVSGSGKGRIDDQSVSLHLNAIGFSADLQVVRGNCTQAVELVPESGDVKRVSVELKKSGC